MRSALFKSVRTAASRCAAPAISGQVSAGTSSLVATRCFSAIAGNVLSALTKENPHVDVVRYEHKNRKWSMNHVDYYSEALAIGFLENGLRPGDSLLCYLPKHFSETVSIESLHRQLICDVWRQELCVNCANEVVFVLLCSHHLKYTCDSILIDGAAIRLL